MKLSVDRKKLDVNPTEFMRKMGYGYIFDRRREKESYVRRLTGDFYPRLHMYVDILDDRITFNLHLDQKQASYKGQNMHNAEYDGEVVEGEMKRVKAFIIQEVQGGSFATASAMPSNAVSKEIRSSDGIKSNESSSVKIGHGNYKQDSQDKRPEKKSIWQKLLGS